MAWAVELRVPFLDHELLAAAWALPPSLKVRCGIGKHLLRVAMAGRIPRAILQRPKRGFPVPLVRWLRTSLYGPCRERLLAEGSACREIFGARWVGELLEEHRRGEADRREELYAMWVFEEWHRAFLARGREEIIGQAPRTDPERVGSPASAEVAAQGGA
jgi:asparagine synthase (glutamine-hydrolysing)